ncbi:MAG: hypothetical protein WA126_02240 [Thermodesulfovibrionales bacterium]
MKRINYLKILFTGIFLLTIISLSYAVEWEYLGETDSSTSYYDKENIKHMPNNIIRVWTKKIFSDAGKEKVIKKLGDGFKDIKHSLSLVHIK